LKHVICVCCLNVVSLSMHLYCTELYCTVLKLSLASIGRHLKASWPLAKRRGVVYNFGRVCLSACLSDNNFRKSWRIGSSYLHIRYKSYLQEYKSTSYMKVIGSRLRSQEQRVENPYPRNAKLPLAITPIRGWSALDWKAILFYSM